MKALLLSLCVLSLPLLASVDDEATSRIAREINEHGKAYSDLRELTAQGPRLSGSPGAAQAVQWGKAKMESYGFDKVFLQPVSVPHWTRGAREAASIVGESATPLAITALGNSIGTGGRAVEAEVVEVQSLQEVAKLGSAVRGKIVFYNRAMDPNVDSFEAYGKAVDQRAAGASQAAKFGAVAALVRSLSTLPDDDHPHTGMMRYSGKKIPAAAVSTHGANLLSKRLRKNPATRLRLELSAEEHPFVKSYNVVGEITGREIPGEYVVVGGHLDSWDLAQGAHDDGAGAVQSIEVLRAFHALGIRPKRSVRAVLFMAEELGGFGGQEYAKQAKLHGETHIAATESDRGGFAPVAFEVEAGDDVLAAVREWLPYLKTLGIQSIAKGGSGTDVEPLDEIGAATFGYVPVSTHYFDIHHSALDVFEAVKESELHGGAAAMGVFTYLLAEKGLPGRRKITH